MALPGFSPGLFGSQLGSYFGRGGGYSLPQSQSGGSTMDWTWMLPLLMSAVGGFASGRGQEQDFADWEKMKRIEQGYWKKRQQYTGEQTFGYMGKGLEEQWKYGQQTRQQRMADLYASPLKPQQPYYGIEKNLPGMDYVLQKAVLGNLGERYGKERMGKYGINLPNIRNKMGLNQPFGQYQQQWLKGAPQYQYPAPGGYKFTADLGLPGGRERRGDGNGGGGNGEDGKDTIDRDQLRKRVYTEGTGWLTLEDLLKRYGLSGY